LDPPREKKRAACPERGEIVERRLAGLKLRGGERVLKASAQVSKREETLDDYK